MTEQEGFRFGILLRCAEEGLTEAQTQARVDQIEKRAEGAISTFASHLSDILNRLGGTAKTIGVGAYPLVGGLAFTGGLGGGYLAGKALDPHYTPDDVKRQELISAYTSAGDDMDADLQSRKDLARDDAQVSR